MSRRFKDRGHDCLGPRDFHCIVTTHGELQRVTVPPGAPNIATSYADHGPARISRAAPPLQNPNVQNSERLHGKGCWPHPRVRSLSRGGAGGHSRCPEDRVPPLTSSKSRRARMPACPVALAPVSRLRRAPEPLHASWLQLLPLGLCKTPCI
jgi:hypothetical protein